MMEMRLKSTHLELLFVCLCLLTVLGPANGEIFRVKEGNDVVLPCFISPERNITQDVFDWRKGGQTKVFLYAKGQHYNNGREGQDEQFKGRVSHFPDELQFGDASILIRNITVSDSGTYSCDISPDEVNRQTFYFELVVGQTVVRVTEGSEAVLPCFTRPERDIRQKVFDWKKGVQTEVFFYEKGQHYNNGRDGQDDQFKGRVSHFPDQLESGDASIRINNTKPSDNGMYFCHISPGQPNSQTFFIELVVVSAVVTVTEGSEAVLPCFINPKRNIRQEYFYWWKDNQGVFFYDRGQHNSHDIRNDQFKRRVSHFPDQLQSGDASIRIRDTKLSDNGTYSCTPHFDFDRQTFYIELVVDCDTIKDRSEENIRGASPKPAVTSLKHTKDWAQLQCEVQGVSPKPEVKWQDSDGNILPAEELQVTERDGSYNIILNTTVTKTDSYRCVVTQEEICHQVSSVAFVYINESSTGWIVSTGVFAALFVVVALVMLYNMRHKIQRCINGPQMETERNEEKNPSESAELKNVRSK